MTVQGVLISPRRKICDDRGAVFHMLRKDDPEFREFGEIYFSKINPSVIKAWHFHKEMTLNYLLVVGHVRVAIFDDRNDSPTRGNTQEIHLDEQESKLIVIPPRIWYGFKSLGTTPSIVANCATLAHNPQETLSRPAHDPYFKYEW